MCTRLRWKAQTWKNVIAEYPIAQRGIFFADCVVLEAIRECIARFVYDAYDRA